MQESLGEKGILDKEKHFTEAGKVLTGLIIKGIREATETGEIRVIMAELLEAEVEENV